MSKKQFVSSFKCATVLRYIMNTRVTELEYLQESICTMGFMACVTKSSFKEGPYLLRLTKCSNRDTMFIPFSWSKPHFPTVDEALRQIRHKAQDNKCGSTLASSQH